MKKFKKPIIIITIILLLGVVFVLFQDNEPGEYDDFARCIDNKGVKMYGTLRCTYCKSQKKSFGKSKK